MKNSSVYSRMVIFCQTGLIAGALLLLVVASSRQDATACEPPQADEAATEGMPGPRALEKVFLAASFRSDRIYVLMPRFAPGFDSKIVYDPKSIEYLGSHGGIHWLTAKPESSMAKMVRGFLGKGDDSWQLWSGSDRIGDVKLGEPVVLARIVPHFGMVQEWEDSLTSAPNRSAQTREDLMGNAEVVMAFPVEGDSGKAGIGSYDEVLWVRPSGGTQARMAQAVELPPSESPWMNWTSELPDWKLAADRVMEAFRNIGADATKADSTASYAWKAEVPGIEPGSPPLALGIAALTLGDTLCGQGPDEASILAVWKLLSDESKGEFIGSLPADGDSVVSPRLLAVGDMDGDGLVEVVVRGELITNRKTIYQLKDNKLVPIKSDFITYADCPC